MRLLTKELQRQLPPLYTQEDADDPQVVAKFFHPASNWTWYAIEASPVNEDGEAIDFYEDGADVIFFGLLDGFEEEELGYFSLAELESVHQGKRGLLGLPVERDLYFAPKPLSAVRKKG